MDELIKQAESDHDHPFFTVPLAERLRRHHYASPAHNAIALFQRSAAAVPAYRAFLQEHRIDPTEITDVSHFQQLPLVNKNNYMRAYDLPLRCWQGRLDLMEMIAVSSGSTGTPLFWPRSRQHELEVAARFEQLFAESFQAGQRSTLAIVCFAMGTWVGGMYSAQCCRYLSQKGYRLTLATPGNNKNEIFRIVTELGPHYDQVVLLGYPPFIKDVIDSGLSQGVNWPAYAIKMVFAGEVFSEEWRALVCQRAGSSAPSWDTASLYGTADAGVLGNETPLSITLRRMLAQAPAAARTLFGESRLPSLLQYDPLSRYFEVVDNTLVVTGDSGTPLIRYHIADKGGVITYPDMIDFITTTIGDPLVLLGNAVAGLSCELPFVYLFGRADFTVSFFGANVYPENITVALEQPEICQCVTGKFVLEVQASDDHDEYLSVTVELLPDIVASVELEQRISAAILAQLRRLNSEFANYVPQEYQAPVVKLRPLGDADYFPLGIKHRYTRFVRNS